jgi:hypothetical protein
VDNLATGFSIYSLEDMEFIQDLPVREMKPYAKQIRFGEDGRVVVGGRKTGLIMDSLSHDDDGLAQAIAVSQSSSLREKALMSRRQTVATVSIPL